MSTRLVSDLVLDCFAAEGVTAIFGNPGTTELPLMEALTQRNDISYYLGLQEIVCMGMADGYALATGRPSVVNLHASPGLGNAMGNLFSAWRTGSPVVVTAGQQDTRFNIEDPLLFSDMTRQASQYTKWVWELRHAEEAAAVIARAFSTAAAAPSGPTFVSLPMDIMTESAEDRIALAPNRVRPGRPDRDQLQAAAALIAGAARPIIVAGDRADTAEARSALVALAERVGASAWAEPMAQRLPFPPDHDLFAGFLPPFGPQARGALEDADLIIVVGSEAFLLYPPFAPGPHLPAAAGIVQIDSAPDEIGKNHPASIGLVCDIATGLIELTDVVPQHPDRRRDLATAITASRESLRAKGQSKMVAQPTHPASVALALSEIWRDCPLVEEAVSMTGPLQRCFPSSAPRARYAHRAGGLGWGLPAALGVSTANTGQRTICVLGDGATMYAVQGLWTASRYGLPITFVILDNGGYEIIRAGLRRQGGHGAQQGVYVGTDFTSNPIDWMSVAKSMNLNYVHSAGAVDVASANARLEAAGGPGLLHVTVDGNFRLP